MGEITKAMQIFETVHLPKSKVSYPIYLSQTRSWLETLTWEDGDSIKQLVSCQFIFQSFKTLKSLVCFNCKLD